MRGDENIIALHRATRPAFHLPRIVAEKESSVEKLQEEYDQEILKRRSLWRSTLDRYGITHVVPRLSGENPDYRTFYDLHVHNEKGRNLWQQVKLGSMTSAFYRTDLNDPKLKEYLKEHQIDFVAAAFKTEVEDDQIPIRPEWARSRSVYDTYLSRADESDSLSIQKAKHFISYLMAVQTPGAKFNLTPAVGAAMAHLAIQNANQGLSTNPQNPQGYRALAKAYEDLARLEAGIAQSEGGSLPGPRRYYQAVQAYQQALTIAPDHAATHFALYSFYRQRQKLDLALRELETYERLTAGISRPSQIATVLKQRNEQDKERLKAAINQVDAAVQQGELRGVNTLAVAQFAYSNGCSLLAKKTLTGDEDLIRESLTAQLLLATLMMESGESEQANELLEKIQAPAQAMRNNQWRSPSAIAKLGNGRYANAIALWAADANDAREARMGGLLRTLPLIASPDPQHWPLQHSSSVLNGIVSLATRETSRTFNVALSHLETGQVDEASKLMTSILANDPETSLRPLIRFYLFQATGERVDHRPPSDWIPVSSDMFADESAANSTGDTAKPDGVDGESGGT